MASQIRAIIRAALEEDSSFSRSNPEQVVRAMLADARTENDKARRAWAAQVLQAYFADNLDDFIAYLKRFAFEKPEDKAQIKSALVRKYAYAKASVFNQQPQLIVKRDGVPDDDQTALLKSIMETGRWFEALQQAARFEKILSTVNLHLRPVMGESAGTARLETITPDETVVFQDPFAPERPFALMYRLTELSLFDTPHEEGVNPELWAFWSADTHFLVRTEAGSLEFGDTIDPPDNPERENPYGLIPFVKIQNENPGNGQYWGPLALDIWLAEMSVSAGFVAVLEAIIEQGFSITFSSGFPKDLFEDGRGTGSHYNVAKTRQGENTPTFGSVKLDANIAQMVDGADAIAQHVALMRGLSPSEFSIKQAAESGFSKLVDLAPQMEEREGDIERWTVYLKELFELLKVQWPIMQGMEGFDPIAEGDFTEDAELFVSFSEPKIFETPMERLDRIEKQIGMGLMTKAQALMEIDPDLSEEEAEMALEQMAAEEMDGSSALLRGLRRQASEEPPIPAEDDQLG